LPVTLTVAWPLIYAAILMFRHRWSTSTFSEKSLTITFLFFAAHNIDFAFLRMMESAAVPGFTIATLLVFALSMFAPAVVIETVTAQKAKYTAEMDLANRIQMEMLPKEPKLPGYEIACFMKPATDIGGDYYDVYSFGDESWVLLGDVTGHGLGSGLVMFMAQSIMSSVLHTRSTVTPSELNYIANGILYQNLERLNERRPMTIAALNLKKDGSFKLSGNHDDLFVYRAAKNEVEMIRVNSIPFGLGLTNELEKELFSEEVFKLKKGDVLLIGTDGITEATKQGKSEGELYGEERVKTFLKQNATESLEKIKLGLVQELSTFADGNFRDDVTFILLRAKV